MIHLHFGSKILGLLPLLVLGVLAPLIFGAAQLYVGALVGVSAAISCTIGWSSCDLLRESAVVLLVPPLGRALTSLFKVGPVASEVASTASEAVRTGEPRRTLISSVLDYANASERFCRVGRVLCYSATEFPETAEPYAGRLGRKWTIFKLDRDGADARRTAALADIPTRPGLDRDEFPFAVTRQGGSGAPVTYVTPAENRSAGALLGQSVRQLSNQRRFLFVITDLPAQQARTIDAFGGTLALGILAESLH